MRTSNWISTGADVIDEAMSMVGSLWLVPAEAWAAVLAGRVVPEERDDGPVWRTVPEMGTSQDFPVEASDSVALKELSGRLDAVLGTTEDAPSDAPVEPPREPDVVARAEVLDLGSAWHALHFMLTGAAWQSPSPLCFIAAGGVDLDDRYDGYGPPRGFTNEQLRTIAAALERTTREGLAERFDPRAMSAASIYPAVWSRPDSGSRLEDILAAFEGVRSFIVRCSSSGAGLVARIT